MKATQRDFLSIMPRAAKQCTLFFFCGPDEAGAAAAASKLLGTLPDPGERIDLTGAELKADPVRLVDEARSTSLFGDTRHLYVRVQGEEAHEAIKGFIQMADAGQADGACPILMVATSASDKSRSAKLLIKRDDALVAMFWPPDLRSVTGEVRTMADTAGIKLGGDLAERIARGAGLDVRLAQSEVTKLALYLDASPESPCSAKSSDLDDIGAKTEEDGFMPLVNAVLSGEMKKLPAELVRMKEVSLNPVAVALALERRAAQLASLAAKLEPGGDITALLDRERVFWRDKRDLSVQLRRWNGGKLQRLIPRLTSLHRALISNSQAADVILAQSLAQIARFAAVRR